MQRRANQEGVAAFRLLTDDGPGVNPGPVQ